MIRLLSSLIFAAAFVPRAVRRYLVLAGGG